MKDKNIEILEWREGWQWPHRISENGVEYFYSGWFNPGSGITVIYKRPGSIGQLHIKKTFFQTLRRQKIAG